MTKSLSIVGADRVGRALRRRLHDLGWRIDIVCASTEASARKAARSIRAGRVHAELTAQVLASNAVFLTVRRCGCHALAIEEAGVQLLMKSGSTRAAATKAWLSLSPQVLANYEKLGPLHAWTGPLSRGDYGVVASYEAAPQEYQPEFLEAYQSVSPWAARALSQVRDDTERAEDDFEGGAASAKSKGR
jgi:predicted short-subunit dehydrogenase-like oxidoreductase (DUF2520 family)